MFWIWMSVMSLRPTVDFLLHDWLKVESLQKPRALCRPLA